LKPTLRIALIVCVAASILFSSMVHAFAPRNGHWWNPNESGSGYNIDVYNGVLVLTAYSYKTNGDSEWYLASGPLSADQQHFTGTLDKYRNGQCISCAYPGRPALIGNDGLISITFLSETSAVLSLPGGRVTNIVPFFPVPTPNASLDGTYRLKRGTVDYLGGPLIDTANGTLNATGTMTITGNQITQTVSVTVNGSTVTLTFSGTMSDFGSYVLLNSNGLVGRAAVIARGALVITETNNAAHGATPSYAEVDQWEFVSLAGPASEVEKAAVTTYGSWIGSALGAAVSLNNER